MTVWAREVVAAGIFFLALVVLVIVIVVFLAFVILVVIIVVFLALVIFVIIIVLFLALVIFVVIIVVFLALVIFVVIIVVLSSSSVLLPLGASVTVRCKATFFTTPVNLIHTIVTFDRAFHATAICVQLSEFITILTLWRTIFFCLCTSS